MTQPSVNLLISLLFGICVLIGLIIWVWTRPVVSKSSSSESNDKKSEDSTNDKKSTTSGSVDEQLLAWQNCFREDGNANTLKWNSSLANRAQQWADYLAREENCVMRHPINNDAECNTYLNGNCNNASSDGQNIASWSSSNPNQTNNDSLTIQGKTYSNAYELAVRGWFDECEAYKNNTSGDTGHFSQLMWSDTTDVGCGVSECKNGDSKGLVVCNYSPAGNVNLKKGKSDKVKDGVTCPSTSNSCTNI